MIRKTATRVLIIEDEQVIAEDLAYVAQKLGHRVIGIARTHIEAMALVDREFPDLILSDIKLADGSSGQDAVREIRAAVDVPAIFITGSPDRFRCESKREATFLVEKPYREEALEAVIAQALGCGCPDFEGCTCGGIER